ncbi:acid phosphatase [Phaffia rhodozyma]|uniref:Acid phosphatase n=1 Tax=Phaffia rhodozyma TaxID=264483 RepID=A0A0F7SQG4_PHARH|nr:acid phosphatase [Phaffia rhodozyma]
MALLPGCPLPLTKGSDDKHFKFSQIRFILNDTVLPLHNTYAGCEYSADGFCSFDTVLTALKARIDEIDYDHAGVNYNGLAPYP